MVVVVVVFTTHAHAWDDRSPPYFNDSGDITMHQTTESLSKLLSKN